jgi:hypothetical protein
MGRTVEKILRPNTKKGITKEQHITQSLLYRWELGRTVENTLKTKHKERITREHHSPIPALGRNWVGLLKNITHPTRKESQRAAHHSIRFLGWGG